MPLGFDRVLLSFSAIVNVGRGVTVLGGRRRLGRRIEGDGGVWWWWGGFVGGGGGGSGGVGLGLGGKDRVGRVHGIVAGDGNGREGAGGGCERDGSGVGAGQVPAGEPRPVSRTETTSQRDTGRM